MGVSASSGNSKKADKGKKNATVQDEDDSTLNDWDESEANDWADAESWINDPNKTWFDDDDPKSSSKDAKDIKIHIKIDDDLSGESKPSSSDSDIDGVEAKQIIDLSLPWVKQGNIITLTNVSQGKDVGALRVTNKNGSLEVKSQGGGRQAQWLVEVVDGEEKLIKFKSLYTSRYLRVNRVVQRKFLFLKKEIFQVRADGTNDDNDNIVFKVLREEGKGAKNKVVFQLQCQGHKQEKLLLYDQIQSRIFPSNPKLPKKVFAGTSKNGSFWTVKKTSKM